MGELHVEEVHIPGGAQLKVQWITMTVEHVQGKIDKISHDSMI